ncbi:MAG: hypothetical protein HUK22_07325, partial [Thermoguttaceae bacterium]|nr:hypothetical protein [Thermoguttaceae bacterium]
AAWFNPRTGVASPIGVFPQGGELSFVPPSLGELLDWVLILDSIK